MAEIKFKGKKEFINNTMKEISNAIERSKVLDDVVADYKKRRRSGLNPKTGKKYKGLKSSTINSRKAKGAYNNTHGDFKANKANVTFTGQLIDAIKYRYNKATTTFTLFISGKRKPYKKASGGTEKTKNTPNNKELAEHLEKAGYPVLKMSKVEIQRIVDIVNEALRKFL